MHVALAQSGARPGGHHGSVRSISKYGNKCWTIEDRQKRDLGITAAVTAIIAISDSADTAAGVGLSQTVQAAETVNQLVERVSNALNIQNNLNGHIFGLFND